MNAQQLLYALTDLDSDLILDAKPPLSSRSGISRRRLMTVLLAAVFVLSLAACGAAVRYIDRDLIFDYFLTGSASGLSEKQAAYLKENTRSLGHSQTIDGYTITIDSAIADGQDVCIAMTVTAPDGVILDADDYDFLDICLMQEEYSCGDFLFGFSQDGDPAGGILHAAYSGFGISPGQETWTLQIKNLEAFYQDGGNGYWIRPTLAEGTWSFDITFEADTGMLELIREPVVTTVDDGTGQIRITSLQLRPLSLSLTYEYLTSHDPELGCRLDFVTLVTKDGTQLLLDDRRGGWNGTMTFRAGAPILFEDADYLLFPDGTSVDIP